MRHLMCEFSQPSQQEQCQPGHKEIMVELNEERLLDFWDSGAIQWVHKPEYVLAFNKREE